MKQQRIGNFAYVGTDGQFLYFSYSKKDGGRLDCGHMNRLSEEFFPMLNPEKTNGLIIDASNVQYLFSFDIGIVAAALRRLDGKPVHLLLDSELEDKLSLCNLDKIPFLKIHNSYEELSNQVPSANVEYLKSVYSRN